VGGGGCRGRWEEMRGRGLEEMRSEGKEGEWRGGRGDKEGMPASKDREECGGSERRRGNGYTDKEIGSGGGGRSARGGRDGVASG